MTQQITLAGLYRGGFFEKAAFYGGTCLRIMHELERYSEDMDFSLLEKNDKFNIEDYFPAIIAEFKALGRDVTITKKEKKNFGKVDSAFIASALFIHGEMLHLVRPFCRKDACACFPQLEEPNQKS